MNGGTIQNNTAANAGGGIYIDGGGVFNMNDGLIQNNSATNNGGGVLIWNGSLNMSGGRIGGETAETRNTAGANGGGVFINSQAALTMSGTAVISGNSAVTGGGVFMDGGDFNMNGNTFISDNTTSSNGAGALITAGAQFTMSGNAVVSGNTITGTGANIFGGGVYIGNGANFTMNENAVIQNNNAPSGGGVLITDQTSFFTFNNGRIFGNTATSNGGGLFMQNGTVEMSGGRIGAAIDVENDRNRAASGGGVFVNGGTFYMSGTAVISGNNATSTGGGVMINGGTFRMENGGTIGEIGTGVQNTNTASNGGGVNNTNGGFWMGRDARVTVRGTDNDIYLAAGRYINLLNTFSGADKVGRISPASYIAGTTILGAVGVNEASPRFDVTPNGTVEWVLINGALQLRYVNAGITIEIKNMEDWDTFPVPIQNVTENTDFTFTVPDDYASYEWYVRGVLRPEVTGNQFVFNEPLGVYELVVVVTNNLGETRSGRCTVHSLR